MHLLVRETLSLDQGESAVDLGQSPADLLFLSFAESDLGALATAWQQAAAPPTLRLANLAKLKHPLSVDLYAEQVAVRAKAILVRLLGGLDYWRYGAEELAALARQQGIALALIPGDGRADPRLAALSTVSPDSLAKLDGYFREGGPANAAHALAELSHVAGFGPAAPRPEPLPQHGPFPLATAPRGSRPLAALVLYRAHVQAGDTAPLEALAAALDREGLDAIALQVASLKDPAGAAWVAAELTHLRPAVVLNATAFSARLDGGRSPLEAADAPILQLVLGGNPEDAWQASSRGLSQADLAMQVVLPELDGRLLTTVVSFKTPQETIAGLEAPRVLHRPHGAGIALAARRAAGWAPLAGQARGERKLAVLLSDYPGAAGQAAHAVGLDGLASLDALLADLHEAGYDTAPRDDLAEALCRAAPSEFLSGADYRRLFATLPQASRAAVEAAWGPPPAEPLRLRYLRQGKAVLAIQPDRGQALDRRADYHSPDLPPAHLYLGFYLWLREVVGIDAMVHLGTHGTLEWLPGKAVALSESCFPAALLDGLPVVYPFIVNNPGEAAVAKRRLGAVTLGHLTPPLRAAGSHGATLDLERLIDEYAAADGLDRRRTQLLRREILDRAESVGLLEECGASRQLSEDDRLARLDAYLCDVKDLQIREGLHVLGRAPSPAGRDALLEALHQAQPSIPRDELAARLDASAGAERRQLLHALDGRFAEPGPAGAPTRGRADVLPTGRNLFTVDPRAIPTRSAVLLAEKAAEELLRRHLQETGDWPRALVLDLWGSTSLRTGGEDLALALILIGARPLWDEGSARVGGIEILPLARLDRPRVDVTLRISGLFRDAFQAQILLFDQAVRAVAERDEAPEFNPLAAEARGLAGAALRRATTRIYGAAPGAYGDGLAALVERGTWQRQDELGRAYLAHSSGAYGQGLEGGSDTEGFARRVASAEAFVHLQDHRELDLLDSLDFAEYQGGFAAAAATLGASPKLWHADTSSPDRPKTRALAEELRRVVRGRAANPLWLAGMQRHGYRGAAEIARTVEGLFAFAATLPERFDRQFDQLFDATLADPAIDAFLARHNPEARGAMARRFDEALQRDLWQPRRNTVAALLQERLP